MIAVRLDPAHPHGGFALLETDTPLAGATVGVEVFDSFAGRFLGERGWQATRFTFGPYPVEEGRRVRIGPEIVNQLNEYQPVRLGVGTLQAELSWPDDVVPSADAALAGGILTSRPDPRPAAGGGAATATGATAAGTGEPGAAGGPETGGEPSTPPRPPESLNRVEPVVRPTPKPARGWLFGGLAALLLVAAGGAYLLKGKREPAAVAVPPPPAPVAETPPAPDESCGLPALTALSAESGFAAVADKLRQCGQAVSKDDAFGLIEAAVRTGDGAALTVFGTLYDGDVTDEPLKTGFGLAYADNPAQAADYYHRAVEAGAQETRPRLEAVCARLQLLSDTLSQSAYEDHCGH